MTIDLDKCTGCQACLAACRMENNIPIPTRKEKKYEEDIMWIEMLSHAVEYGTPPSGPASDSPLPDIITQDQRNEAKKTPADKLNPDIELMPRPCFHCWDATCVKVCPVRATYINEEGLVAQIYARCIGCRMCTVGCPYSVRQFNWKRPEWPSGMMNMLNPDVAVRPKHVVERGTFCYQRRQIAGTDARVEEDVLAPEGDYVPACAEACPADAIQFGDIDDPTTEIHELVESPRSFVIKPGLGQKPKVFYLSEKEPLRHLAKIGKLREGV